MHRTALTRRTVAALVAVALLAVGCGGADDEMAAADATMAPTEPTEAPTETETLEPVATTDTVEVPDVVGRDAQLAADSLEALGLQVALQPVVDGDPGVVVAQNPPAGSVVADGVTVVLEYVDDAVEEVDVDGALATIAVDIPLFSALTADQVTELGGGVCGWLLDGEQRTSVQLHSYLTGAALYAVGQQAGTDEAGGPDVVRQFLPDWDSFSQATYDLVAAAVIPLYDQDTPPEAIDAQFGDFTDLLVATFCPDLTGRFTSGDTAAPSAPTPTSTPEAGSATPSSDTGLVGTFTGTLPTSDAGVAVVATSAPGTASPYFAAVVHNPTAPLACIDEIVFVARAADGTLIGTSTASGITDIAPARLQRGEYALVTMFWTARDDFGGQDHTVTATVNLRTPADECGHGHPVQVLEHTQTSDQPSVVGTVDATGRDGSFDQPQVHMVCFAADGTPRGMDDTFADVTTIDGQQVGLFELNSGGGPCPGGYLLAGD